MKKVATTPNSSSKSSNDSVSQLWGVNNRGYLIPSSKVRATSFGILATAENGSHHFAGSL